MHMLLTWREAAAGFALLGGAACATPTAPPSPVSGALEKLKMQEVEGEGEVFPATWRAALVIDLDGDGRRDLEHVLRCNAYQPSGCDDRVCSEVCTRTRRVGESEPARETRDCTSFIPDAEDCQR